MIPIIYDEDGTSLTNWGGPDIASWAIDSGDFYKSSAGTAAFFNFLKPSLSAKNVAEVIWSFTGNAGYYHDTIVRCPNATQGSSNWTGYDVYCNETTAWGFVRGVGGAGVTLSSGTLGVALGSPVTTRIEVYNNASGNPVINAWVGGTQVVTDYEDSSVSPAKIVSGAYTNLATFGVGRIHHATVRTQRDPGLILPRARARAATR